MNEMSAVLEMNQKIAAELGLQIYEKTVHGALYCSDYRFHDWASFTDDAIRMVLSQGCRVELYPAHAVGTFSAIVGAGMTEGNAFSESISEAVCRAWLKFKKESE